MNSVNRYMRRLTPWGNGLKALLHDYGLGTLFAANVLGAGSIYILSQTGASTGFALLWVLPLAFAIDMVMHDMSARMASNGRPLMSYIRGVIGSRNAKIYAVTMALIMQLWAVANYAVAGYAAGWFIGYTHYGIVVAIGAVGVLLVYTGTYRKVEAVISAAIVIVFGAYLALVAGLPVQPHHIVNGLIPSAINDGTLIIAMLGTTVYYPNFFIQSSMRPTKGWFDIKKYRRDNAAGIGFSVIVSAAILSVAAVSLDPGELTLTGPAQPLIDLVGPWTMPLFMVAVLLASFTSATGTMFGAGFAVPQAFGIDTEFGDPWFTVTVMALIWISIGCALAALTYTNLTPVRMAIVMPALNGAIYLPLTILAMYMATWDEMGIKQRTITALTVVVMFAGSLLTAQSLYTTVIRFL